ncbi:hypothetical protein L0F63_000513 [Massospora cicadina]|nr:hypothetical protein L0F63_000513 [Massospora cicadina]
MSQTMSQVMEQFLLKGLIISIQPRPHKDGFQVDLAISNEGDIFSALLALDLDFSLDSTAVQPICKMNILFSFDESIPNFNVENIKDLVFRELEAASKAFSSKSR